nr:oligopeptide/dipeptide ABC transporter ATP-binding protein [Jiangella asiatica]
MSAAMLQVRSARKTFESRGIVGLGRGESIQAVRDVSFDLAEGETMALVGESGCGKTTLARMVVGLETPTSGSITFEGRDLSTLRPAQVRQVRRRIQMVFQDPYASLNPYHTVERIVSEPWRAFPDAVAKADRPARIREILRLVGLDDRFAERFPHQLSGGQRQRVGIARALAVEPRLIVCDEPVASLDVSVQAQIVNLLRDLQDRLGVAYLFITHDLRLVSHIADRVGVMYLGKLVESGATEDIYDRATHPYTQALLGNVPLTHPWREDRPQFVLGGEVPSPADPPSGCGFRTRCWRADQRCADEEPALVDRLGHPSACHYASFDLEHGATTTLPKERT